MGHSRCFYRRIGACPPLTKKTISQIHALLSENGLLALNFVSFLEDGTNIALASVAKTLAEVFPYQLVFISEPGVDFNDFIFIASNQLVSIDGSALLKK